MKIVKFFTLKTYWGRYLIFTLVSLVFSFSIFTFDDPEFPSRTTNWFFYYFGSHLVYWALYISFTLQFMLINNSNDSFTFIYYKRSISFILWVAAILVAGANLFHSLTNLVLAPLRYVPMGLAIALVAYHLRLKSRELDSTRSD